MNEVETRNLNKPTQFTSNMNNNEESIIYSALNVIKQNNRWIETIKNHNLDEGFLMTNNPIIMEIKDAIYLDNPLHSGCSLALTLRKCNDILNK
jgi:hypothetical protein